MGGNLNFLLAVGTQKKVHEQKLKGENIQIATKRTVPTSKTVDRNEERGETKNGTVREGDKDGSGTSVEVEDSGSQDRKDKPGEANAENSIIPSMNDVLDDGMRHLHVKVLRFKKIIRTFQVRS